MIPYFFPGVARARKKNPAGAPPHTLSCISRPPPWRKPLELLSEIAGKIRLKSKSSLDLANTHQIKLPFMIRFVKFSG
jgi:hypothetical protein